MTRTFCCYLLTFTTTAGKQRLYYGTTELKQGQTPEEACAVRLRYHRLRPKKWMHHALATSLAMDPLETLSESLAMAPLETLSELNTLRGGGERERGAVALGGGGGRAAAKVDWKRLLTSRNVCMSAPN